MIQYAKITSRMIFKKCNQTSIILFAKQKLNNKQIIKILFPSFENKHDFVKFEIIFIS